MKKEVEKTILIAGMNLIVQLNLRMHVRIKQSDLDCAKEVITIILEDWKLFQGTENWNVGDLKIT